MMRSAINLSSRKSFIFSRILSCFTSVFLILAISVYVSFFGIPRLFTHTNGPILIRPWAEFSHVHVLHEESLSVTHIHIVRDRAGKTKMKFILCVVDDMDKHFEIIIIHEGYFTKLCDNLTYIRGFFLYPSTYSYIKLCGFFRYDFNYIRLIK